MLIRLVREYLRPYRVPLLAIVVLQFLSTVAMLYLPSLNADIIDHGVVTGDTAYILRHGGLMLLVSVAQIVCSIAAVWFSATPQCYPGGGTGSSGRPSTSRSLSCHQPTSCQDPSFQPMRRWTPTASKPSDSCSATLASLGRVMPAQAS